MTSLVKPEQSKSAAVREQLPAEIRQKIEENRARNAVVTQIRGTQWGSGISQETARAVAQYAYEHGMDPVTEVEVLGGRIYPNALYFRRRGAPLLRDGTVRGITAEQIGNDPRLETVWRECVAAAEEYLAAGDMDEAQKWRAAASEARFAILRRKRLRIDYNAPENAAAVCVTTITLASGVEVKGVNWCGGGIRKGDPVGDAEPAKTAETRSERRAWIKLITSDAAQTIPALQSLARAHRVVQEDGAALSEILVEEQAQLTAGHEAARPRMLAGATADDPYAQGTLLDEPARDRTSMDPEADA